MKRYAALLLPALIVACGAPPAPEIIKVAPPKPTVRPLVPTVKARGVVELTVDTRSGLSTQAVNPNPDSSVTFDVNNRVVSTLDVGSNRFISVRFPITANAAFNNLTLAAYFKEGNTASSAFKNFQSFGGNPTSTDVYSIRPAHGMKLNGANPEVDINKADLQVLTTAEASSLTTAARGGTPIITANEYALEYGFVARRCTANCASATPTWSRSFASGQSGEVNITVRVPQAGDVTGYRFSMTFIVANDTATQYSQSLEDIGTSTVAGIAQTNATITGSTSVRVLCNSAYASANRAFVLGARTAGNGATPLAQYGAQFYRNATTASFSVIPNTQDSFSSGVSPLYTALNGATLTFGGGSSVNGANVAMNSNGSFTFNPAAGSTSADTANFTVSDDQGCTNAPQTVAVSLSGPVIWYVNGSFVGSSDGRKTNPFKTLAAANTASGNGHTIFAYTGNYAALTLKLNQNLIGQLEGLAVQGNTIVAPGTSGSTLIEAATTGTLNVAGLTLNTGAGSSIVRGVNLTNTLSGTNFGTLNLSNVSVTSSGAAVNLDGGSVGATFQSVSSSGGTNGIKLNAITGSGVTVTGSGTTAGSGGTISGTAGSGILATNVTGLNVQYMNISSITAAGASGVQVSNSTATTNLVVKNNSFQGITGSGFAIAVSVAGASGGTFDLSSNTIGNGSANVGGITLLACGVGSPCTGSTVFQGRVNGNTLQFPTTSTRIGIDLDIAAQGKLVLQANSNTISNYGLLGMRLGAREGNANLQVTATGNTISIPTITANNFDGLNVISGSGASFTANTLCLNATSNNISVPTNAFGIVGAYLEQRNASGGVTSNLALQGISPSPNTNTAQIETFVKTQNPSLNTGAGVLFDSPSPRAVNQTCETVSF